MVRPGKDDLMHKGRGVSDKGLALIATLEAMGLESQWRSNYLLFCLRQEKFCCLYYPHGDRLSLRLSKPKYFMAGQVRANGEIVSPTLAGRMEVVKAFLPVILRREAKKAKRPSKVARVKKNESAPKENE